LKKRLAPTDRARKLEVAKQYQDLKQPPSAQQSERWLQQWEKIYTNAKLLQLPEVYEERPLYDFLTAIKDVAPSFAGIQEVLIGEKVKKDETLPMLFDIIEDYRNHLRLNRATTKSSSHTAFTTFQNEPPQPTEKSEQTVRPCLCGEVHRFRQCLYLIQALQAPDWVPDPQIERAIGEKMQNRPWLQDQIKRAQQKGPLKQESQAQTPYKGTLAAPSSGGSSRASSKSRKPTQQRSSHLPPHTGQEQPSAAFGGVSTEEHTSTAFGGFAVDKYGYKLQNCWTLDSAADIHICNDPTRFKFKRAATDRDVLYAGTTEYPIQAFGTVDITVQSPHGPGVIQLLNTALIPGFLTNLVALRRFTKKGVHWDTEKQHLHRNGNTFCFVQSVDDHWVLERNPQPTPPAAFASSRGPSASAALCRGPPAEKQGIAATSASHSATVSSRDSQLTPSAAIASNRGPQSEKQGIAARTAPKRAPQGSRATAYSAANGTALQTVQMPVDGLTNPPTAQKRQAFVEQPQLVDAGIG
jgi:hypothetical protein